MMGVWGLAVGAGGRAPTEGLGRKPLRRFASGGVLPARVQWAETPMGAEGLAWCRS